MDKSVVNVSFQRELSEQIDKVAETEKRTRSELLGDAARIYIERKKKWDRIFACGESLAAKYGLTEEDVAEEIKLYREEAKRYVRLPTV